MPSDHVRFGHRDLHLTIRPPVDEDAGDIQRIAYQNQLPPVWHWPEGKHGLVVEHQGAVRAFCVLHETIYGLVVEELWEEPSATGMRALALLRRRIEEIAQSLADERGEQLACGGIVRLEKNRHIEALKARGYEKVAEVYQRLFLPKSTPRETAVEGEQPL